MVSRDMCVWGWGWCCAHSSSARGPMVSLAPAQVSPAADTLEGSPRQGWGAGGQRPRSREEGTPGRPAVGVMGGSGRLTPAWVGWGGGLVITSGPRNTTGRKSAPASRPWTLPQVWEGGQVCTPPVSDDSQGPDPGLEGSRASSPYRWVSVQRPREGGRRLQLPPRPLAKPVSDQDPPGRIPATSGSRST